MIKVEKTEFEGILKIHHKRFNDERGFFAELFRTEELREFGFNRISQQNISLSNKGVIRGLHYQIPPYEQSKIITVLSGSIYDIAVDIRKDSKTYLNVFTINIDMDSDFSLLIPKGFAHGFQSLEDESLVLYSVDNIYSPEFEKGINIFSNKLDIIFPIDEKIISERDENLPEIGDFLKKNEER